MLLFVGEWSPQLIACWRNKGIEVVSSNPPRLMEEDGFVLSRHGGVKKLIGSSPMAIF